MKTRKMSLKRVVLYLILIEVFAKSFVEGLQCYVCESCNEYEDFKELHICGKIPTDTVMKPIETVNSGTKKPTRRPSVASSAKPLTDDYLYEDSGEKYDEVSLQNSKPTTANSTKTTTTTRLRTSPKPVNVTKNSLNETSTSASASASTSTSTSTTTGDTRTTRFLLSIYQSESTKAFSSNIKITATTTTAIATSAVTLSKPKPAKDPDYDDYLEYEDDKRSLTILPKNNEPVCYMFKYHVNSTILVNRGCTTFINANKYLTCQSLYNGAPMESCRICSSNGCNKFLHDAAGDENNYGLFFNAADGLKHFRLLTLWIVLSRHIL